MIVVDVALDGTHRVVECDNQTQNDKWSKGFVDCKLKEISYHGVEEVKVKQKKRPRLSSKHPIVTQEEGD
eukprot:scaffold8397_cov190-Amphora_coffeaeformis.AAC.1